MTVISENSRPESKSIHYLVFQQQRSHQKLEETTLSRIKDPRTWLCEHRGVLKSWPRQAAGMSVLIVTEALGTDRWEMPVAIVFYRTISTLSGDKSLGWLTQARCLQSNTWVSWYLPWLKDCCQWSSILASDICVPIRSSPSDAFLVLRICSCSNLISCSVAWSFRIGSARQPRNTIVRIYRVTN